MVFVFEILTEAETSVSYQPTNQNILLIPEEIMLSRVLPDRASSKWHDTEYKRINISVNHTQYV